jgi:hypothetical protein
MSQEQKLIGVLIGEEEDWYNAFIQTVNQQDIPVKAELAKISYTQMDGTVQYDVLIDRISHIVPYYRSFLKFAVLHNTYVISNPYTWTIDSRFFGTALVNRLGLKSPRTIILPNKYIARDATPDTFRNLAYPMDWQAIIDYVGVPAIFKNNHIGGRQETHRVQNVDQLIEWYDESGTRTKILQQIIESDVHIHSFVVGHDQVMSLRFSIKDNHYQPEIISNKDPLGAELEEAALRITHAYQYDINMVEFVIHKNDTYVINGTNPTPQISHALMNDEQFNWCVQEIAKLAIDRALRPLPQQPIVNVNLDQQ